MVTIVPPAFPTVAVATAVQLFASATVTVIDTTNPVAIAQNITLPLDANGQLVITPAQIDNGSYDNCDFTLSVAPNSFSSVNVGDNTVIFVIADASGNSHYTTATVTILDTIDPIVITQNITVNLDSNGSVSITPSQVNNGSTDNVQIASMSVSTNSFTCSELGANVVTLTITDTSGNSASEIATVTVADVIAIQLCHTVSVLEADTPHI